MGDRTVRIPKLMVGDNDVESHIDDLDPHREIDDNGTTATDLWSAEKIAEYASDIDGETQINDNSIPPIKLKRTGVLTAAQDGYVATYNNATDEFDWEDMSGVVGQDTYQVKWDVGDAAEYLESKIEQPAVAGDATKLLKVNATYDGYDMGPTLELPTTGDAEKLLAVNAAEDGFELVDRVKLISSDLTIYIRDDGSDSNTGLTDSAGGAFYSLVQAFEYLDDKWINPDVTVTIDVAAGSYTSLAPITIKHPCAHCIEIVGDDKATTTLSFAQTASLTPLITIEGVRLKTLTDISLVGYTDDQSHGICMDFNAGITAMSDVNIDDVRIALRLHYNSHLTGTSGVVLTNVLTGVDLYNNSSIGLVILTIDHASRVSSIGVKVVGESYANLPGLVITDNTLYGVQVFSGKVDMEEGGSYTGTGTSYAPAVTTDPSSSITRSVDGGGWIFKPT